VRRSIRFLIVALASCIGPAGFAQEPNPFAVVDAMQTPKAIPPADAPEMKLRWKNGPHFSTDDGLFTFQPGGRFQFDAVATALPASLRQNLAGASPFDDGVNIRRARLGAEGSFYHTIEFKVEFEFANSFVTQTDPQRVSNVATPTDFNLTFRELPGVGNIRIGNQKQPISFEHITSSKYLNFLERSQNFDGFTEGFNNGFVLGAMAFDNFLSDKRGYWALGLFKSTRSNLGFNVGRNEADLTGRVVVLPIYENEGERLLHVGIAGSYRDLDDDQQRYRTRFGLRSAPGAISGLILDTGLLSGDRETRLVPELAGVCGPWSFQAEYFSSWLTGTRQPVGGAELGTTFYQGAYVEAHYFLTGEHRAYDHERMTFGRIKPLKPLRWTGDTRGWGAWQLAARYGFLDLDDKGATGGLAQELVLGVNWILTANARLQANYVLTHRNVAAPAGDGFIHGVGVRTAWDF